MEIKKTTWKRILIFVVIGLLVSAVVAFAVNTVVIMSGSAFISHDLEKIPVADAALILGAKVYEDGRLSHMMQDRADSAVELYESGKVKKLIMSGDHGTTKYDEVNTVKDYLLEKGVREEDLFLDHAGFDTYDSLYRARDIFDAKSIIVVTQKFHQPRAVFIGRSLGIDVHGYIADKREYQGILWNEFREIFSRTKAGIDIVIGAKPKFLGEKIPLDGDSKLSWD